MKSVEKAIWYIESHYGQSISLDNLAAAAGISRYHLSRVFAYTIGIPVNRYLRDRRLSQAAVELADGQQAILDLALSLGYNSHEAFSRAFKKRFGQTPETIRAQGHTDNLNLLEAVKMITPMNIELNEPVIVDSEALLLAGLSRQYSAGNNAEIPGQWQAFGPHIGVVPGRAGKATYGVVYNMDENDNHEYLCAVEVAAFDGIPDTYTRLRLPASRYAVFRHQSHVSDVQATCVAIWRDWLPGSGHEPADAPFFERYPATFNPETGYGGLEVWLPIK